MFFLDDSEAEEKRRRVTRGGGGARGTLGEKGLPGSHRHLSAKRGACEGKAEAAIPALGWYHVKLSVSSPILLRGFVSHANSGSGPQLAQPSTVSKLAGARKKKAGGFELGGGPMLH